MSLKKLFNPIIDKRFSAEKKEQLLQEAAFAGDAEACRRWIRSGANMECWVRDIYLVPEPMLRIAVENGHAAVVALRAELCAKKPVKQRELAVLSINTISEGADAMTECILSHKVFVDALMRPDSATPFLPKLSVLEEELIRRHRKNDDTITPQRIRKLIPYVDAQRVLAELEREKLKISPACREILLDPKDKRGQRRRIQNAADDATTRKVPSLRRLRLKTRPKP